MRVCMCVHASAALCVRACMSAHIPYVRVYVCVCARARACNLTCNHPPVQLCGVDVQLLVPSLQFLQKHPELTQTLHDAHLKEQSHGFKGWKS